MTTPRLFLVSLTLLWLGSARPALANDWIETPETCARLGKLVTAADIEKITRTKPISVATAVPDRTDGCSLDINMPKTTKAGPTAADITLKLQQHLSPGKALGNLALGAALAANNKVEADRKVEEVYQEPRGKVIAFKYVFDYVSATVNSTEITLIVRDRRLKGPQVAKLLGMLVHRRALESPDIATYSAHSNEVVAHMVIGPMLALVARCLKDDAPAREATQKAFDASAFKRVSVPPAPAMSAYAQRWIKANRVEEMVAARLKSFSGEMTPALASDCARSAAEIPALEQALKDQIAQVTPK